MKIQRLIGVVLSGLGLFLSSWIVIPAPIFAMLPLGVGAPEISPLLLAGNSLLLGVSLLQRQQWFLRHVAIAFSTCAVILSSLPLLQLPTTIRQADIQMQSALGADYQAQISDAKKTQMRSHPFILTDLVRGLPTPKARRDHQSFAAEDGTSLALEIYRPTTTGLHPSIIAIYGGGWQSGEPEQNARFHTYMAHQGYTVVAIDYRHAPRYHSLTSLGNLFASIFDYRSL